MGSGPNPTPLISPKQQDALGRARIDANGARGAEFVLWHARYGAYFPDNQRSTSRSCFAASGGSPE